jgi:hypothetical protein
VLVAEEVEIEIEIDNRKIEKIEKLTLKNRKIKN